jgi:hypothetical protein
MKSKTLKLIESIVRKNLKEGMPVYLKDDLLRGITFEELVETLQSNESVHDERAINRVFNEILKANLEDIRSELRANMKFIIQQASYGHNE